jgi:predicted signal transduction protein with EAL and GGDEF domain
VTENAFVARIGGEEFAMPIHDAALDKAWAVADLAREAVKTSRFPYRGDQLSVTASFGVAELRAGEDAAALFHRADQALYTAKHNGRDSVYWHDGEHLGRGLPAATWPAGMHKAPHSSSSPVLSLNFGGATPMRPSIAR